MSNVKPSISAYSDEKALYAHDSKSLKYYYKHKRKEEKANAREEKRYERKQRAYERKQRRQAWRQTKKDLYYQAHSQDRTAEAYEAANTVNPSKGFIKRYSRKLNNRDYRRMVREARRFR